VPKPGVVDNAVYVDGYRVDSPPTLEQTYDLQKRRDGLAWIGLYRPSETMIHSVRSHAKDIVAPASASAAQVHRGFCEYETHCVACHGASAVARERWVSGMEPAPPYLLDATHRFKPRELFWIAKNGIKMTGMPSWKNSMSDRQIWDLVAFLEAMPKMDSQTYVHWRAAGICPLLSARPSPGPLPTPRP